MLLQLHQRLKMLARRTGWSDEVLHIHFGLAIFLGTAAFATDGIRSILPLLITAAVEIVNEVFDRLRKGSWRWHETIPDLFHTLLWPIIIHVTAKWL